MISEGEFLPTANQLLQLLKCVSEVIPNLSPYAVQSGYIESSWSHPEHSVPWDVFLVDLCRRRCGAVIQELTGLGLNPGSGGPSLCSLGTVSSRFGASVLKKPVLEISLFWNLKAEKLFHLKKEFRFSLPVANLKDLLLKVKSQGEGFVFPKQMKIQSAGRTDLKYKGHTSLWLVLWPPKLEHYYCGAGGRCMIVQSVLLFYPVTSSLDTQFPLQVVMGKEDWQLSHMWPHANLKVNGAPFTAYPSKTSFDPSLLTIVLTAQWIF